MGDMPCWRPSYRNTLWTFLFILSITTTICSQSVGANAKCYFLSGREAKDYVPCNQQSDVSSCCLQSEFCLFNGLCWGGTIGVIYRGGCTDRGWKSSDCPRQCLNDGYTDGWTNIISCGDGSMACAPDWGNSSASPCTIAKNRFGWNETDIIPRVAGALNLAASSTVTAIVTAISRQGVTQITTNPPQPSQCKLAAGMSHTNTSTGKNTAIAVGLGTGLPLFALSLALAAALIIERRKRFSTNIHIKGRTPTGGHIGHEAPGSWNGTAYPAYLMAQKRPYTLHEADTGYGGAELSS